jgi:hypothetical protein
MANNSTAPHSIVIVLKAQVHEVLPTGELSGNVAHKHNGGQHEIFRLDAMDRDVAIRKLNELVDQLRKEGFAK